MEKSVLETEYFAQFEGPERMGAFVVKFRDVKWKFWSGSPSFSGWEIAEPSLVCCISCFGPKSIHQVLFGIRSSGVHYRMLRVFHAEDSGSLSHRWVVGIAFLYDSLGIQTSAGISSSQLVSQAF